MSATTGEETLDPSVKMLMGKFRQLTEGKRDLEKEIEELESNRESLEKELETLQNEACELDRLCEEKEDLNRKLKFQCEEPEQEIDRLLKQRKKTEELLEQHRFEIQELKLKQQNLRMMFISQLEEVIQLHKNLFSIFSIERLPDEIKTTENLINQLQVTEKMKLARLQSLDEELEDMRKQNQPGATAAEIQGQ